MLEWKKVKTIELRGDEKAELQDSEITIYKKERSPRKREIDITGECTAELRRSSTSSGYYCAIKHQGTTIFALGVDDKSMAIPFHNRNYRLVKAPDATVSFRVIKEGE